MAGCLPCQCCPEWVAVTYLLHSQNTLLLLLPPSFPQFLGWYNPLSKETSLNAPSIKKWLEVGAQPSDTVAALLKKAMVLDS